MDKGIELGDISGDIGDIIRPYLTNLCQIAINILVNLSEPPGYARQQCRELRVEHVVPLQVEVPVVKYLLVCLQRAVERRIVHHVTAKRIGREPYQTGRGLPTTGQTHHRHQAYISKGGAGCAVHGETADIETARQRQDAETRVDDTTDGPIVVRLVGMVDAARQRGIEAARTIIVSQFVLVNLGFLEQWITSSEFACRIGPGSRKQPQS